MSSGDTRCSPSTKPAEEVADTIPELTGKIGVDADGLVP